MSEAATEVQSSEHYILIVDTDRFSGPFCYELVAFSIGVLQGIRARGIEEYAAFNTWCSDAFGGVNPFSAISCDANGAETGERWAPCARWLTPGKVSDGSGKSYKAADLDPTKLANCWEAYDSVAMFFRERPNDRLIGIVRERAELFAITRNIEITGIRLAVERATITRDEIPLEPVTAPAAPAM